MWSSQITGYDSTNVQKGAVKNVTFEDNVFSTAPVLETLYVAVLLLCGCRSLGVDQRVVGGAAPSRTSTWRLCRPASSPRQCPHCACILWLPRRCVVFVLLTPSVNAVDRILKNCRLSSLPTQLGSLSNLVNLCVRLASIVLFSTVLKLVCR